MDQMNLPATASAVDPTSREFIDRELNDPAFVADLLGLDDDDDEVNSSTSEDDSGDDDHDVVGEVEHRPATTSDDNQVDAVVTEEHDDARGDTTLADDRAALEARILDTATPIADLIEREVARLADHVERQVAGIDPDEVNINGINVVESLRWQVDGLRRRLEHAVTCPWPVRPAHRAEKLPRWQRLRILRALGEAGVPAGGLRTCPACAGYGFEHASRCQVTQLRTLSMQLGDLDYWLDLPRVRAGEAVDARWPEVLKPALWKRWRSLRAEARGVADMSRGPAAHAAAQRSAADASTPQGTTAPLPGADACPGGAVPVARSAPTHVRNTPTQRDSITVGLPVELIDRRAELGDHALYVLCLLALPHHPDIDNDGWRPLEYVRLEQTLGARRVDGKIVHRVAEVLGAPERPGRPGRPGLLEQLGLIERRSGYFAAPEGSKTKGYPQHYRLADQSLRAAARDGVELVLRERGNLPERERREGSAVHPWLLSSHTDLALGYFDALADLCVRAGVEISNDPAVISAAIGALDPPKPVRTKAGKLAAKQLVDPRRGWQAELVGLGQWALPDAATRHELHRDANVNRLWSPLSTGSLPREARQFLTLAGRPIVWLDIRAAGMVLRAAEMRREGADTNPDCRGWMEMVELEDPYIVLHALVHGREPTADERDAWKQVVFRDLYYSTVADQMRSKLGQAVKRRWPGYFDYLLAKKREVGHAEFACGAQRLEAAIIIDALPPVFEAEGIQLVTKHDAIGVRDLDADRARELFVGVLAAAGVRAVVR